MKQTGTLPFAAGNIVKGTIIEVRPKEVLVDIGYKSEGVISGSEFEDWLQAEEQIRHEIEEQAVDEASEDSFPASDPPAH